MRVTEAARLLTTGYVSADFLWQMTTTPERVVIALLAGRPDWLPARTSTPTEAWDVLNARYRRLLLRRAPHHIQRCLPERAAYGVTGAINPRSSLCPLE
ncbi:hypothetical protein [Brytella acorum]|uniref:Uncharacterized protein n=1 Tax=Brytella acorum TaxID=2959299 RepID=A0AA35UG16_9PROT|nr:hypothetical protein [Brytella acorum]MDF3623429.1 hypothetical protein [Brytella acorum]CAI9120536.1 hypothetical protein LMG32879_001369 [Brytella acorum]